MKKNKNYKGSRPANADEFDISVNTNLDQSLLQVKSNQVDYDIGGLPPSAHADLGSQYGVNKANGQYHVNSLVETDYVALNTAQAPFNSVNVRKAANFAIDRPAMLRVRGKYAGQRTDQILPPGMGGFRNAKVYPIQGSNYTKAKALAGGNCKNVNLWTANSTTGQALGQVFKLQPVADGLQRRREAVPGLPDLRRRRPEGRRLRRCCRRLEPGLPGSVRLPGRPAQRQQHPRQQQQQPRLLQQRRRSTRSWPGRTSSSGAARYKAYGDLDLEITKKYAPWASYDNRNEREFTSARVGGYLFQPANASADLNTLFVK